MSVTRPTRIAAFLAMVALLLLTDVDRSSATQQGLSSRSPVSIAIDPATKNVSPNSLFTVDIQVRGGSQSVAGVAAYLSFDRNYLRVVDASGNETGSVVPGGALPRVLVNNADNGQGTIRFEAGLDLAGSPISGGFVLATIRFKAIAATPSGGTAIAFLAGSDVLDSQGNSVLGSTADGNVTATAQATFLRVYLPVLLRNHLADAGPTPTPATPTPTPTALPLQVVGQTGGSAKAIAVQGDYAYVGIGPRLVVLDVSEAAHPLQIGHSDVLPEVVLDVAVLGSYAYVADEYAGLRILDVSNPASPRQVATWQTSHAAWDVYVSRGYAYVADGSAGLRIIDISDPRAPALVGSYATQNWAVGVAVAASFAYVASYDALRIVDVIDAAHPVQVGEWKLTGSGDQTQVWAVAVAGGFAYVACGQAGLHILDVSDPSRPTELGVCDDGYENAIDIAVVGNRAFVADVLYGLHVIDVSNPSLPAQVGFAHTHDATKVALGSGKAFVADGYGGLQVFDVTDEGQPRIAGAYQDVGMAVGVAVEGNHAYVAGWYQMQIVDVAHAGAPRLTASYVATRTVMRVAVSGNHAYVSMWGSPTEGYLQVFDVANPLAPAPVGTCLTPGGVYKAALAGNYAYVAAGDSGLRVIRVAVPSNPVEVGACDTSDLAVGVAVAPPYAYVIDFASYDLGSHLRVIDVSDPLAPREVGSCSIPEFAHDVAVAGQYAYVAAGSAGLQIVDVSAPAIPRVISAAQFPWSVCAVALAGRYACVAANEVLAMADMSDPHRPVVCGNLGLAGFGKEVVVAGGRAYVAREDGGLFIVDLSLP